MEDTEDLRRPIFLLKMRYWQHMKASELFWKWLVVKHSSFRYNDCLYWAGCSEGGSPPHIMQLILCGVSGSHNHTVRMNRESQSSRNLRTDYVLA